MRPFLCSSADDQTSDELTEDIFRLLSYERKNFTAIRTRAVESWTGPKDISDAKPAPKESVRDPADKYRVLLEFISRPLGVCCSFWRKRVEGRKGRKRVASDREHSQSDRNVSRENVIKSSSDMLMLKMLHKKKRVSYAASLWFHWNTHVVAISQRSKTGCAISTFFGEKVCGRRRGVRLKKLRSSGGE